MAKVKVMGHNPPDTDSTCSPIVYAWFLQEFKNIEAEAVIGGEPNREAKFVLNYFGASMPETISELTAEDKVVLLDTNNPEELISGWDQAEIIEIIDHHKLSGIKTLKPIEVTIRKYGSVPTVMWEVMLSAQDNLTKEMAGLMLAPIISDTLKFTSPTTTGMDREVADKLAGIAGVNIDDFAAEMFAAKSDLTGMSAREILLTDQKNFEFGGKKYKIAVLETTDVRPSLAMAVELKAEAEKVQQEESLENVFFLIVDIINSEAHLLGFNPEGMQIAEEAFSSSFTDGVMRLPGVTSRKTQIAPMLGAVLER
jgi:manganese-dependent inorganic pyrophosphatase